MFLIRQAGPPDFSSVFALAKALDSYNLPADPGYIHRLLRISEDSFHRRAARPKAKYLFVLEHRSSASGRGKIVGCSLIIAKHGVAGHPHLWFSMEKVTKRSGSLGIRRTHPILRLGYTEDGPTEVGGLVVLPSFRRHPELCGMQISYVRFLYMAMHPERFESEILVEYRGALGAGNKSPFWEAIGHLFTGLSYKRADRLSVTNKEFILSLLPMEPIYCALLPQRVQAAIGAIHPVAQRAARLLHRIGFRPIPQIEPFDGGPYYSARRNRIRIISRTRRLRMAGGWKGQGRGGLHLVGTEAGGAFRAAFCRGVVAGNRWFMGMEQARGVRIQPGDAVYVCPISR